MIWLSFAAGVISGIALVVFVIHFVVVLLRINPPGPRF